MPLLVLLFLLPLLPPLLPEEPLLLEQVIRWGEVVRYQVIADAVKRNVFEV